MRNLKDRVLGENNIFGVLQKEKEIKPLESADKEAYGKLLETHRELTEFSNSMFEQFKINADKIVELESEIRKNKEEMEMINMIKGENQQLKKEIKAMGKELEEMRDATVKGKKQKGSK